MISWFLDAPQGRKFALFNGGLPEPGPESVKVYGLNKYFLNKISVDWSNGYYVIE